MNSSSASQAGTPSVNTPSLSVPPQAASLEYLATPDGHRIPVRHWPLESARAVVHISHGMAEHSGCYADVAARLNAAGYAVLAHDHRCHGLAVPEAGLGNIGGTQQWAGIGADMVQVNQHVRSLYLGKPLVLLGHSMGSFISLQFAEAHSDRIDALLLEGSNYEAPWFCRLAGGLAAFESWRQGEDGRSPIINALTFGGFNRSVKNPRTPHDWVSRCIDFIDRYNADPRCGFQCSNGYWRDFLGGLAEIYAPHNLQRIRADLPLYLFAGAEDPVGHGGRGVRKLATMLSRTASKPVQPHIYEGVRHDILHEINADTVTRDLLDWLGKTV